MTVNAEADIARNLAELRAQTGVAVEILVVDNGSVDRTLDLLAEADDVRVIANGENRWLAPAWNQGLAASEGEYVLFLTPDASLPEPDALRKLADALAARPRAALAGPRLLGEDGSDLQNGSFRFPSVRFQVASGLGVTRLGFGSRRGRRAAHAEGPAATRDVAEVELVNGACMLARREALDAVGGLDDRYRLYWEEIDLARRLRDRGWSILLVPDVTAVHRGKGSPASADLRRRAYLHGERVYIRAHHGRVAEALVRAGRLVERARLAGRLVERARLAGRRARQAREGR